MYQVSHGGFTLDMPANAGFDVSIAAREPFEEAITCGEQARHVAARR